MKKLLAVLVSLVMVFSVLGLIGCGNGGDAPAPAETPAAEAETPDEGGEAPAATGERQLIAFSQGESGNSWRATNTEDMEYWAERAGFDFVWADGNNDAMQQLADIENLLALNPDILIVAPLQADAITPAVQMSRDAGIPMITIDRALSVPPDGEYYLAMIEQDFVEVGRLGALRTVEKLTELYGEPRGRVLEIQGTIGASPAIDQAAGVREILDQFPDIEIVDAQSGNYNRAESRAVMDDFLIRHPEGTVDILITHCDDGALGALQAMRDAGRTDLYGRIISKNGMRTALTEVIAGTIDVTYACPPRFGEVTMELVRKILNGEPFEAFNDMPFETFDMRENRARTLEHYEYLTENNLDF